MSDRIMIVGASHAMMMEAIARLCGDRMDGPQVIVLQRGLEIPEAPELRVPKMLKGDAAVEAGYRPPANPKQAMRMNRHRRKRK